MSTRGGEQWEVKSNQVPCHQRQLSLIISIISLFLPLIMLRSLLIIALSHLALGAPITPNAHEAELDERLRELEFRIREVETLETATTMYMKSTRNLIALEKAAGHPTRSTGPADRAV